MAKNKIVKKKAKKAKGILQELDAKIRNNRKRVTAINKKLDAELRVLTRDASNARKNSKNIRTLLAESAGLRKQEKKDRRRIIKAEDKVKNATADLSTVKVMVLKDLEPLKSKVGEHSDLIVKEVERLNKLVDSLKEGILKGGGPKITVTGKKVIGGTNMPNEDIATRLVNLYFQEVARTGFKKSLTLSEIVNAYQYVLGRLEGIEVASKAGEGEMVVREEKVSREAENLMKDIDKLKVSIDTAALKKMPEKEIKGFSHTNKRGVTYYLHQKGKLFYFSKDPMHAVDKPEDMIVIENKQTGLPLVKRK